MAAKKKLETFIETDVFNAAIRCLELQARLLLIASALEGFQLQSADVACIGGYIAQQTDKLKESIVEQEV